MNKDIRKSLIERYLNAETDETQERFLAGWFAAHEADPDEEPAARLLLAEYPEAGYDMAGREFDSIVAMRKRRTRITGWACGVAACAAVVSGLGLAFSRHGTCGFNGLEMAQGIERIMSLDMEEVKCVTACPKGDKVILTAVMNDGSKCSYLMSRDEKTSAISITAKNK